MVGNWAVCILLECFLLRAVGAPVSGCCLFYLPLGFGDTLQHSGHLAERPVGFHEAIEVDNRLVRQRQTAQDASEPGTSSAFQPEHQNSIQILNTLRQNANQLKAFTSNICVCNGSFTLQETDSGSDLDSDSCPIQK